jgi:hypothetical protein
VESERWRLSSRRRGDTIEHWGYCENLHEWGRSGQRKGHAAKTLTTNLETATVLVSEHVAHAYELVIRQIAALFRQVNIYSYILLSHFVDHDVLAVSISGTPFRAQYTLCQQDQESGLRSFPSRSMNTPSKCTIAHSIIEKKLFGPSHRCQKVQRLSPRGRREWSAANPTAERISEWRS